MPYSLVLFVPLPIPPDKRALVDTAYRIGLLHQNQSAGAYVVQVLHRETMCPICAGSMGSREDRRTLVACPCGGDGLSRRPMARNPLKSHRNPQEIHKRSPENAQKTHERR